MGTEYPKRESHFAHRFTRLMAKCCAAQDIGPEGCWLVAVIAHTEDAKRYSGAVTFYNEQLMPLCGFTAVTTFARARKRAVDCGWLHYEPGFRRRAGRYWVMIPEGDKLTKSDGPIDESSDSNIHDSYSNCSGSVSQSAQEANRNRVSIRSGSVSQSAHPSTLVPFPDPGPSPGPNTNTCPPAGGRACDPPNAPEATSAKPNTPPRPSNDATKPSRSAYSADFENWYALYPRHEGKGKAAQAFGRAVGVIVPRFGGNRESAVEWLCEAAVEYGLSPQGRGQCGYDCPHPASWLNAARYDDDRSLWHKTDRRSGGVGGDPRGNIGLMKKMLEESDGNA